MVAKRLSLSFEGTARQPAPGNMGRAHSRRSQRRTDLWSIDTETYKPIFPVQRPTQCLPTLLEDPFVRIREPTVRQGHGTAARPERTMAWTAAISSSETATGVLPAPTMDTTLGGQDGQTAVDIESAEQISGNRGKSSCLTRF